MGQTNKLIREEIVDLIAPPCVSKGLGEVVVMGPSYLAQGCHMADKRRRVMPFPTNLGACVDAWGTDDNASTNVSETSQVVLTHPN